jgi:hypothetical protein
VSAWERRETKEGDQEGDGGRERRERSRNEAFF